VLGGLLQRELNDRFAKQKDPSGNEANELFSVASDSVFGFVGGKFGNSIADAKIPLAGLRQEIAQAAFAHRRSLRGQRIADATSRWKQAYLSNSAIGGVVGGARTTIESAWYQNFWNAIWLKSDWVRGVHYETESKMLP
jgi:hypothetical protein